MKGLRIKSMPDLPIRNHTSSCSLTLCDVHCLCAPDMYDFVSSRLAPCSDSHSQSRGPISIFEQIFKLEDRSEDPDFRIAGDGGWVSSLFRARRTKNPTSSKKTTSIFEELHMFRPIFDPIFGSPEPKIEDWRSAVLCFSFFGSEDRRKKVLRRGVSSSKRNNYLLFGFKKSHSRCCK